MGYVQEYRDTMKINMKKYGFNNTGFRKSVRGVLQEYDNACWEAEWQGIPECDQEERYPCYMPSIWPRPTGWRKVKRKDKHNREWIVFECVEPVESCISERKIEQYTELWDFLDYHDDLIVLHLYFMSDQGKFCRKVNLSSILYSKESSYRLGVVEDVHLFKDLSYSEPTSSL